MTAATFFLPQFIFLSSSAHPDGESGAILCRLVTGGTIAYIGGVASVVTLIAIAAERYYAVMHPLKNIGKLTDRKMKVRLANVVRLIVAKKGKKRGMPRCSLPLGGYACLRGLRKKARALRTGTKLNYETTTATSMKTSLRKKLRILSSHFAIIPSRPVI